MHVITALTVVCKSCRETWDARISGRQIVPHNWEHQNNSWSFHLISRNHQAVGFRLHVFKPNVKDFGFALH